MSIVYLIFIALAVFFSFQYDGIEEYNSRKQHRLWLMCVFLICLTGFSYGLGADKFTYMEEFEYYPTSFSELPEYIGLVLMTRAQMPLWTLFNGTFKILFDSFYTVQLLESTVVNITVCYLVTKYTHRYFLFLIVYFLSLQYFIFNTEVMREGFAMSFSLLGIHGWMNGKKWLFAILVPFGLMFHFSAFIALLFPFVRFKVTWKTIVYTFFVTFAIWLVSDLILSRVVSFAFGDNSILAKKLIFYSIQATNIFGFIRNFITFLLFPFIIMHYSCIYEQSSHIRACKERMTAFMLVLGAIACSFSGFGRFYNYVQIFYLIMFADFIYMLIRDQEHLIIRMGTFVGTVFLIMLVYLGHYSSTDSYFYEFFYPYTCIIDEDESTFFRKIAHEEAVNIEMTDDNYRNIE